MKKLPNQTKKNNKTGVTGVAIDGRSCHSYIVNDSGRRISRKFSLAMYGKHEAVRLAIKWRREREIEIHGHSVIPENLIEKDFRHIRSVRVAESVAQIKKLAASEQHIKKQKELAQHKKNAQKMAGKYIYRIDDLEVGHGWLLRIESQNKTLCDMIFRDSLYGSVEDALEHAEQEREKQLVKHKIPYARGRRFSTKLRSTNSTGVTGVCRSGCYYHCYIPIRTNKRQTRKIPINKFGEDVAFRMAVNWRQKMEIKVYGDTVLTDRRIAEIFNDKIIK